MPSWLKAALISSVQAFIATLLITSLGLLVQVQHWIDDSTQVPDWNGAARVLGAAFVAAVMGVVVAIHRAVKPPEADYSGPVVIERR
jgi:hypothetical protein